MTGWNVWIFQAWGALLHLSYVVGEWKGYGESRVFIRILSPGKSDSLCFWSIWTVGWRFAQCCQESWVPDVVFTLSQRRSFFDIGAVDRPRIRLGHAMDCRWAFQDTAKHEWCGIFLCFVKFLYVYTSARLICHLKNIDEIRHFLKNTRKNRFDVLQAVIQNLISFTHVVTIYVGMVLNKQCTQLDLDWH